MNFRQKIGKQVAMLRKKHGLSTRQLADLSSISYVNINKIENGKYNVSVDILGKIASALGAKIEIGIISTLEELRDFINSNEDWNPVVSSIIEINGWVDETGEEYGICNDGLQRLYFYSDKDDKLIADIKDM